MSYPCHYTNLCPHKPHKHAHTHTHTHTRTHTHTHTHVVFYALRGLTIGIMVFMCYCPTPTIHLNVALTGDCAFLPPKNSLCMIYKCFEKWGHGAMS